MALVLAIIQQAARAEPELATLWDRDRRAPRREHAPVRRRPRRRHPAAPRPDEAADIIWATNAAELYQLLVGQRGWSPQRYEQFLADTWRRLLLAD